MGQKNRPPWMAVENLLAALLLSIKPPSEIGQTPHPAPSLKMAKKRRLHSEPPEPN